MITTDVKTLAEPLRTVCTAVQHAKTLPILEMLVLEYGDGRLRVSGSDLELALSVQLEADTDTVGSCLLPAHKMTSICGALPPDAPITINPGEQHATVRSEKSRFRLSTLPADDYPLMDIDDNGERLDLPAPTLHKLLNIVVTAQAKNDVRYYLNGVMLEAADNTLRAVATDGHRLHVAEAEFPTGAQQRSLIVPSKTIAALLRLPTEGTIALHIGHQSIGAETGNIKLWSKSIDGKYPEFNRVVPKDNTHVCTVDTATIKDALKRCTILSNDKYRGAQIDVSENRIGITAHNADNEEASDEIPCDYTGPTLTMGINTTYVAEAIAAMKTDRIAIAMKDADTALLIQPPDLGDRYAVVMPMRL